jgi:hypothetical protein
MAKDSRGPSAADVAYVNGTPVAACLHGIDVHAPAQWAAPRSW